MAEDKSAFASREAFVYSKIESANEPSLYDKYPSLMQEHLCERNHSDADPDVLTTDAKAGPCSFFDPEREYEKPSPIPSHLEKNEIDTNRPVSKDGIFKGLVVMKDGGLQCVDKEALDKQKGVLGEVLQQILNNIREGKGIVAVSLPVRIFEDRSVLERICDFWGFAPTFLTEAAQTTDRMDRFKKIIAFAFAGLYVSAQQSKPFNPILGETYQATLADGSEIYCEHISHHPPIANFQIFGPNRSYEFYGSYEFTAKIEPTSNKLRAVQVGLSHVKFPDGHHVSFILPKINLGGVMWGDRTISWAGVMQFFDHSEGTKATIEFDHGRSKGLFSRRSAKIDSVAGSIYYPKKAGINKDEWKDWEDWRKNIQTELTEIRGSWIDNLVIGDQELWNIDSHEPQRQTTITIPLPSDCRYREDLIWLKRKNLEYAANWKHDLEVQQRWDRKKRQDGEKLRTKKDKK
mmetsp:Transcript_3905/g.4289  ORF Transcript_3905/g.4289 Transcript_3905/m.4289 type:complete len:461 (-) Transcript_3905:453-1835(-)